MVFEAKNIVSKRIGLKILSPKRILQRLPIALAQVKTSNNSKSRKSLKKYTTTNQIHSNINNGYNIYELRKL